MTVSIDAFTLELLGLPASARAQLACKPIASLEDREDPDAEAAWVAEVRRRMAEVEEGKVELVSAEEVFLAAREGMK